MDASFHRENSVFIESQNGFAPVDAVAIKPLPHALNNAGSIRATLPAPAVMVGVRPAASTR